MKEKLKIENICTYDIIELVAMLTNLASTLRLGSLLLTLASIVFSIWLTTRVPLSSQCVPTCQSFGSLNVTKRERQEKESVRRGGEGIVNTQLL